MVGADAGCCRCAQRHEAAFVKPEAEGLAWCSADRLLSHTYAAAPPLVVSSPLCLWWHACTSYSQFLLILCCVPVVPQHGKLCPCLSSMACMPASPHCGCSGPPLQPPPRTPPHPTFNPTQHTCKHTSPQANATQPAPMLAAQEPDGVCLCSGQGVRQIQVHLHPQHHPGGLVLPCARHHCWGRG